MPIRIIVRQLSKGEKIGTIIAVIILLLVAIAKGLM